MMRRFRYRVVILSYFFFGENLLSSGRITRFIAPGFVWLTYITILLLCLFLFFSERGVKEGNYLKKEKPVLEMAKLLFLVYPLLLFLIVQPPAIDKLNTASARSFAPIKISSNNTATTLVVEKDGYVHVGLPGLWILINGEPDLLKRYKFKITGKVSAVSGKNLTLQRIIITCCAADAQAVEIKVCGREIMKFKEGEWLSAAGEVQLHKNPVSRTRPSLTMHEGLIMIPDAIAPVPEPDNSYAYLDETISQLHLLSQAEQKK